MVDFLIGVGGGGTATRAWLVDAAGGPAAGALSLIRQLVQHEELHTA